MRRMTKLFTPFKLRDLTLKNRIVVSPMCQYSSKDGMPNDWHLVHLGSRAVGGAALVITEAAAVSPEGRISPADLGIWNDEQAKALAKITEFIKLQGAAAGIQLAHAGRKASTHVPWEGSGPVEIGGWIPLAPSAIAYTDGWLVPNEMSLKEISDVRDQFVSAAQRSLKAGFDLIELHFAHGYLMHEFLSPLTNKRADDYGGALENRMRFALETAQAVRDSVPKNIPVIVRISASDWVDGGWAVSDSVRLSSELKRIGIDLIDCSSGGTVPEQKIKLEPGYQVKFARDVRLFASIPTGAVGLITESHQAEEILQKDEADLIFLARELLRDPHWPLRAAHELGVEIPWPKQYDRAQFRKKK